MLKKVFLAGAVTLLLAGAAATAQPTPAQACHSGCWKAAKAKYSHDWKARRHYRHWCRAHWKAYKKAHKHAS
jgi:hypothetical protein